MGRIVAIAGGDLQSNFPINKYIVNMDKSNSHNLLFIGTASGDAEGYIENIKIAFEQLNCSMKALCLSTKKYTEKEIDELLEWADIIYVGGGDAFYMMEIWRKYGIDKKLKEIYLKDTAILTGISAGAMCWFKCGHSDSEVFRINETVGYGWVEDLLNIHAYAFCPHYEERVESFDKMIMDKSIAGLAMESDTAFVEQNGKIKFIKSNETSKAYIIKKDNGTVVKEQVETEMMKNYQYIKLTDEPSLMEKAAAWFHSKWGVPEEAYLACMEAYLKGETAYGWYLCKDGEKIIAGMGVIENDFHDRKDLAPNVCAVYTEEEYRSQGIAGRLLNMVVEDMRKKGVTPLYLITDHTSFYERYGWEFLCMVQGDGEEEKTRMYIHR